MPKAKKKTKSKKPTGKKVYRVNWLSAAPFLMKNWQLLEVETDKKGKMTAVLLAK